MIFLEFNNTFVKPSISDFGILKFKHINLLRLKLLLMFIDCNNSVFIILFCYLKDF